MTETTVIANKVFRLIRDPLVVFLILGGLIFAAYNYFNEQDKPVISLSAQARQSLIEDRESLIGRALNADEIAQLEQDYISREILFYEAVDRQLHLYDARAKEALIERIEFELIGALPSTDPGTLIDFYSDNLPLYTSEPEYSFRHIYFEEKPDNQGQILADLATGVTVSGDPFWQGDEFPNYGASAIRALFDQDFLEALENTILNKWVGPLATDQGHHFIYLQEKHDAALIPFAEIIDQVRNDYIAAEQRKRIDAHIDQIKNSYDIQIEN